MKKKHRKLDAQVREYKTRDLGEDIRRRVSAAAIRPKHRSLPTSILPDPAIIAKLKEKAEGRGIGY
jgi:hypothetical protein